MMTKNKVDKALCMHNRFSIITRGCYIVVMLISFIFQAAAQRPTVPLNNYATSLSKLREAKPIEKLYLQTDKPYYGASDTLRFKGYLLNADYLTPAMRSGLLYVELNDEQGKNAKRIMVPVINGMAWGDIVLD